MSLVFPNFIPNFNSPENPNETKFDGLDSMGIIAYYMPTYIDWLLLILIRLYYYLLSYLCQY